jgi:hypothetical protein
MLGALVVVASCGATATSVPRAKVARVVFGTLVEILELSVMLCLDVVVLVMVVVVKVDVVLLVLVVLVLVLLVIKSTNGSGADMQLAPSLPEEASLRPEYCNETVLLTKSIVLVKTSHTPAPSFFAK